MTTEARQTFTAPDPDEQQVRDILRRVIDPEVGRDIVSLGLVYRVEVAADRLLIEMTMTSPACPLGDMIVNDVRAALGQALPATIEADVRLVWEPPWTPAMMDDASKQHFGWEADR